MDATFKSRVYAREWRLDAVGIHEWRNGQPYASIPWAELERVDQRHVRARSGLSLAVLLPVKLKAKLLAELGGEWQRRFPERFRANQARNFRRLAWSALLWMPLLCVGLAAMTDYRLFMFAPHTGLPARWVIRADLSLLCGDHAVIVTPNLAARLLRFDGVAVILCLVLGSGWVRLARRYHELRCL